ncbi:MAG: hypothetical protein HOV87_19220 [Catenulispora sp.]|nr:hypothetical protein [Catenulispora sp.]
MTTTTTTTTTTSAGTPPTTAPSAEPPPPDRMCPVGAIYSTPPPEWTSSADAPAGMRWVFGQKGNVVGMLFADPPKAGQDNKILWIVKQPREGFPLQIRATRLGSQMPISLTPIPPDSGPGEIYPSGVAVPTPGCWSLTLSWGAVQDVVVVPFI